MRAKNFYHLFWPILAKLIKICWKLRQKFSGKNLVIWIISLNSKKQVLYVLNERYHRLILLLACLAEFMTCAVCTVQNKWNEWTESIHFSSCIFEMSIIKIFGWTLWHEHCEKWMEWMNRIDSFFFSFIWLMDVISLTSFKDSWWQLYEPRKIKWFSKHSK